jgi:hypothetical protein
MHRSRHPITIRMAPKAELTSDHFVILPCGVASVDRSLVTILAVLRGQAKHSLSSTNVLARIRSLGDEVFEEKGFIEACFFGSDIRGESTRNYAGTDR